LENGEFSSLFVCVNSTLESMFFLYSLLAQMPVRCYGKKYACISNANPLAPILFSKFLET
jgi:hypothetical protein